MNTKRSYSPSGELGTALSLALEKAGQMLERRSKGEWIEDFDIRGELYELAMSAYPEARREERDFVLEWLSPKKGELGLDLASGNGFLSKALAERTASPILAFDPSREQLQNARKRVPLLVPFCLKTDGPEMVAAMPPSSLDFIASLGGIHHIENQTQLFKNIFSLLRPGGRMVAADVGAGSTLSQHFDEIVAGKCLTGHSAHWLSEESLGQMCETSGLRLKRMSRKAFNWMFHSPGEAAQFFRGLHAFPHDDSEILSDLENTLGIVHSEDCYAVSWPLLVFELEKP